ncbi:transient receptor potential cation channel subfamily M member-like 2 [Saccostrea echinata]|uniref:transient receptor potential cation channel subfamily M member-like 2 n=1 Tax=Saccostrea echinata TaxID=191078 RepID=UPI002A8416FA|nr:transient receptor potential cation channel subfamily M member-like 2 [Saccostrea echinata]
MTDTLDNLDLAMDYLTMDEAQYRTVTSLSSYISTLDLDDIAGRVTGGILKFEFDGGNCDKSHQSYFVTINEDSSMDSMAKYMSKVWRKRTPDIILSVISSIAHFKTWEDLAQVEDFQAGLTQALNTTNMWVLTNGLDGGISRIVGDAIHNEHERRYILLSRANTTYGKIANSAHVDELTKLTVIGIVPKSSLCYGNEIATNHDVVVQLKNKGLRAKRHASELNAEHSHFILLEGIEDHRENMSVRYKIEERLLTPIGRGKKYRKLNLSDPTLNLEDASYFHTHTDIISGTCTPMVGLLIQGGPIDIEHVVDLLRRKVPVLVVKGTGLAADLIAFVFNEKILYPGDEHDSFLKQELIKRMLVCYPNDFQDDEPARNHCRDLIIECASLALQDNRKCITILDIEADPSALKNLDKYILLALFESQGTKQGVQFEEQFQSDLKLCMDWNRCDLAESRIFRKYAWKSIKITPELFDRALLKKGREKFLDLFLEKKTIVLHQYLNHKKLLHLFNQLEKPEFFCHVCLEGVLAKIPGTCYPVDKYFLMDKNSDLNQILYKLTGLENLVSSYDLSMNASGKYVCDKGAAERKALLALIYWGTLTNNHKQVKSLWMQSEQPMVTALIISRIWHQLSKKWVKDLDTKRQLKENAIVFGERAVELLSISYNDSALHAIASLDDKLPEFGNKTVTQVAQLCRNKYFIAHKSCQKWLMHRWHGSLRIREVDYGIFKLPEWLKIYLCVLFILPMFFWITYDVKKNSVAIREEEDEEDEDHLEVPETMPLSGEEKWKRSRKANVRYHVKEMLSYGKQNLKVPIYLQFYYFYSAPIVKFYISQFFYVLYLLLFSLAVIIPSCGDIQIDIILYFWTFMLWIEVVRKTIMKKKNHKELTVHWTVVEIILIFMYLMVIGIIRIIPRYIPSVRYTTAKFVMSLGLIYFYYRTMNIFFPISPILGPMMISVKRMIRYDFITWFKMFLIIMVSGGIAIQATLYPNYPLSEYGITMAISRALFAMFLTKIDDLDGGTPECTSFYDNQTTRVCHDAAASFWNRNITKVRFSHDYAVCPHRSFGGYAVTIQYLLLTKLIFITLLYALFSATTSKIQAASEQLWKFQLHSLIVDFETRLRLPAPLNFLSYLIMVLEQIFKIVTWIYKWICRSSCCVKHTELAKNDNKMTVVQHSDFTFWRTLMKKLKKQQKEEDINSQRPLEQEQKIQQLLTQTLLQMQFNNKLTEQLSSLERHIMSCEMALEQVHHKIDIMDPKKRPELEKATNLHMASRESPYPGTTIQRFPVFDKFINWEETFAAYDPVLYTKPIEEYPVDVRPLIDVDYIDLIYKLEDVSLGQDDRLSILSSQTIHKPLWNVVASYNINDVNLEINRMSWIDKDGVPIKYALDSYNIPLNPSGRTGIRGRGKLWRWGPNHSVKVVISRWKRYKSQDSFLKVNDKKVMEVIVLQKSASGELTLPEGKDHGHMSLYSAVCQKFLAKVFGQKNVKINEQMTENQMVEFFEQFVEPHPGPFTGFTSGIIYKGYMDDPCNTDNAWREAEVWNIHYHVPDNLDTKIVNKEKRWKEVSSYFHLPGNQNLIVQETARINGAYYV